MSPVGILVVGETLVVAGEAPVVGVVVEDELAGRVRVALCVTGDAVCREDRSNVADELHVDDAAVDDVERRLVELVFGDEGRLLREVRDVVVAARGGRVEEVERLLAVRVAAAAVVAGFSRAHLVPSLRHVENEAVAIDGLERERGVRRNLREEARVGMAVGIEDRTAGCVRLAKRNLSEDANSFACVIRVLATVPRSVASMRVGLERENSDGPDLFVRVESRVAALVGPIAAVSVLRRVERVETVEGPRAAMDVAREALALVEAARADEAVRRAFGQVIGMLESIVREPRELLGLVDTVHLAVRDHRARPRFVVRGVVLDQDQLVGPLDRLASPEHVDAAVVAGSLHRAIEIVARTGRPDDEQVVTGRTTRMGELADSRLAVGADRRGVVIAVRERRDRMHALRRERHAKPVLRSVRDRLVDARVLVDHRAVKRRLTFGGTDRDLVERPEAVVVEVVVVDDDDVLARELRHEVERLRRAESADDGVPLPAVGVDRPERPDASIAQSLVLLRAEEEATVAKDRRVKNARRRHRRDQRDVRAVLVHDEDLHRGIRVALCRLDAVSIRGEGDAATRNRARTEVEDPVAESMVAAVGIDRIRLVPVSCTRVRCELAEGELLDLPRLEVDAEDVRAFFRQIAALVIERLASLIVKEAVVDVPPIERDEGIGDRAVSSFDEHLFAAVGVKEHQIRARVDATGMENLGPPRVLVVAETSLTNVDDVVIDGVETKVRGERSEDDDRES